MIWLSIYITGYNLHQEYDTCNRCSKSAFLSTHLDIDNYTHFVTPINQWACTFPQTFPPKLSITHPFRYLLLHHRVSLGIHTYLIVYTLNSHIVNLLLTKISKLNLSFMTKSCCHTLSPNEKILHHIYFFCRILRQWRSTARTLTYLHVLVSRHPKHYNWNRHIHREEVAQTWRRPQMWFRRLCYHGSTFLSPDQRGYQTICRWHRQNQWQMQIHLESTENTSESLR